MSIGVQEILLAILVIWSLIWKGFGMWKAARNNQIGWFIAILIINAAGILEITYISFFQKNKNV